MKPKNVLIITPGYYLVTKERGGAIENLIDVFLKYNSNNASFKFTVYDASTSGEVDEEYKNVEFRTIRIDTLSYMIKTKIHAIPRRINFRTFQRQYAKMVIDDLKKRDELESYDVVIIENGVDEVIYYSRHLGRKSSVVLHLHNDLLYFGKRNSKKILDSVKEVWCCSDFIAKRVDGIDNGTKKTKVLYNTTMMFDYLKKIRHKNEPGFNILYTGRIMPEKGVLELVKAFNDFSRLHSDVKLLLIGGGRNIYRRDEYTDEVMRLAQDNPRISLLGNVNHKRLLEAYGWADAQVVPSIWNEAFGLTALEGAAFGVPVIFSNKGGLPEIFKDKTLILNKVTPQAVLEKLEYAYLNRDTLKSIAAINSENAKKFSISTYCQRFKKLIDGVL